MKIPGVCLEYYVGAYRVAQVRVWGCGWESHWLLGGGGPLIRDWVNLGGLQAQWEDCSMAELEVALYVLLCPPGPWRWNLL